MQLLSSSFIGVALLTLLASINPTSALPSVQTFRGEKVTSSLYNRDSFLSEVREPVPDLINPREYGANTPERAHELDPNWVEYWSSDPSTSTSTSKFSTLFDSFLSKTGKFLEFTEELISDYAHLLSPYVVGKERYSPNLSFSKSKWWNDGKPEEFDIEAGALNLPSDSGFDYGKTPVRGVNIGNWLLIELWMDSHLSHALNNHAVNAPTKNPIVDEWTAGQYSTRKWATHVLEKHFDTWIVEDDWKAIKAAGLNHVRIPVPHFAFPETFGPTVPYLSLNRFKKLKEGVLLAKKYGLKVWIDLHSVPASQNGYDNSGHATGVPHWADGPGYYFRTKLAINRLINEFSKDKYKGTVTAIEPVNEPWGLQDSSGKIQNLVNEYYRYSHYAIGHPNNQTEAGNLLMAAHDAFQGLQYWQDFWTGVGRHRVILDTHPYFVYGDSQKRAKDKARLKQVCNLQDIFTQSQQYYPSIAGEFSCNGPNADSPELRDLPVGPVKFPKNGTQYPYSTKYMAFMALNFATQQEVFESEGKGGWIFWAWKNRNALDWSYQDGLKYGWIPKNLNSKPYGEDICTGYLHKIGAT